MARIAGVDIPREKRVEIALTYIYGIGLPTSQKILTQTSINPDTRVRDLTEDAGQPRSARCIDRSFKVEGDLRREVALNIKRLIEIGSYRGLRHRRNLPVRGQRTQDQRPPARGDRKKTVGARARRPSDEEPLDAWPNAKRARQATAPGARRTCPQGHVHIQATLQQHDRDDHRPERQRHLVGFGGHRRVQGLPQEHAVRRRARRGRRGQARHGARHAPGRGLRARDPARAASRPSARSRPPASRSRRSPTSRPSRTTAAARPSGAASEHEETMARYTGPVCRLCRREGAEALPQGQPLLHQEVLVRAAPDAARPARRPPPQGRRLRPAAAREAEGPPHLRRAREAVPQLLRRGARATAASPARPCCGRSSCASTTSCTASASRPRAPPPASWSPTATSP